MLDDDYEAASTHADNLSIELTDSGCPTQTAVLKMLKSISKDAAKYADEVDELEDLDFEPDEDNEPEELDF